MKEKARVFIYDRKEMGALILLGVMVAVFAFTLGVHLGKKVGGKGSVLASAPSAAAVPTVPDKLPEAKDLGEQSKAAPKAVDESVDQALHDEIERTGLKLDKTRQLDLPRKPRSKNAGATTLGAPSEEHASSSPEKPGSRLFTLQIGSYPTLSYAKTRADEIKTLGLRPIVHETEVQGKGTWYRVYLGEYSTKVEAEKAGQSYRIKHVIDTFVVAKISGEVSH